MPRGLRRAFAGLLLLTFVAPLTDSAAQTRRDLRVGIVGLPNQIDPAASLSGAGALVSRQVFETLVAYAATSTDIEPALATRWSVSRDGLVWSFTLREGV